MNILICTIVRDRAAVANYWASKIQEIASKMLDCNFSISVYENDSKDTSALVFRNCLKNLRASEYFDQITFCSEKLGTIYYDATNCRTDTSVAKRLENLSNARNKCIDNMLSIKQDFDKIIFIEPDIDYNPSDAVQLIRDSKDKDIYCGFSVLFGSKDTLYDSWATRLEYKLIPLNSKNSIEWNKHHHNIVEYFKTINQEETKVYSAFSGFCIYSASPIIDQFIRFSAHRENEYDCDTSLICFDFIDKGYDKIYMSKKMNIYHFR